MTKHRASTERLSNADLYREAAREVAEVMYSHDPDVEGVQHKACCTALADVAGKRGYALREKFEEYFRPSRETFWFGDPEKEENRPARILALCFMAAMVEAGDA